MSLAVIRVSMGVSELSVIVGVAMLVGLAIGLAVGLLVARKRP